ncbi:MAG: type II toxin-antitoxin system Phd/YefM family antitoxin [Candidatus Omnitrophica bacterium]|nr:type II toxin-antitoxin system Phd/YefM family antitoxin [Candidatus Omnitrophota bacterium]MDE2009671.1 type II toxin-antitoxin system Phd/YefM family antitoxin [Candidatus Omnitrophota bacterium]MDE2214401.1 type II toxin-antitoxin system Phd/YefM family antitoxin [Candidatus Omnitrophota bacterium]
MTVETIPAVKARTHFGEIMKKSYKKGFRFVVEKSGIPMVVILNAQDYNRIVEAREERFKILDCVRSKLPNFSEDMVLRDVSRAVTAVRKRHA